MSRTADGRSSKVHRPSFSRSVAKSRTGPSTAAFGNSHWTESGGVALWIGPGTEGFFGNVRVTPAP